jgi:hypothetical protein
MALSPRSPRGRGRSTAYKSAGERFGANRDVPAHAGELRRFPARAFGFVIRGRAWLPRFSLHDGALGMNPGQGIHSLLADWTKRPLADRDWCFLVNHAASPEAKEATRVGCTGAGKTNAVVKPTVSSISCHPAKRYSPAPVPESRPVTTHTSIRPQDHSVRRRRIRMAKKRKSVCE